MRYILRELLYVLIMISNKLRSSHLKIEYRAKAAKNSVFEGYNKLSHHSYFSGELGYASYIGANSVVIGKIGRFCSIAESVQFLTLTHPTQSFVSTHPYFYSTKKQSGFSFTEKQLFDEEPCIPGSKYSIIVGNDVYIGFGAIIVGPCRIGDGAVIAAGAVVTRNVEPYSIVGGVPAKHIKYRFSPHQIKELMALKWWNKDLKWLSHNYGYFENVDKLIEINKEQP